MSSHESPGKLDLITEAGDPSTTVLRSALDVANLPTLLLAMAQLSGESRWLEAPYQPSRASGPGDHDTGGFSPERQEEIRAAALEMWQSFLGGRLAPAASPAVDQLPGMLSISLAEPIPAGYGPLLAEEMGLASREVPMPAAGTAEFSVVVVGAGVSGILAALQLKRAGIDVTVIEKDDAAGGTWYENTYPGCGVDTPTHLYSLSFEQRSGWRRYFAKRDQLHEYFESLTDDYGVRENIRFGLEVTGARWDDDAQLWQVEAADAAGWSHHFRANALITGVGYFNRPAYPRIDGLDRFGGPVMHTARWDRGVDTAGKRVAVLGSGASAMQLVPSIAEDAESVLVFQRTPQWGIPHPNYLRDVDEPTMLLMEHFPFYQAWYRARLLWAFGDKLHAGVHWDHDWPHPERSISQANDRMRGFLTEYIRSELGDRADELFDRCLPDYPPYGKRPLLDNGWFRTIARDDVELITERVTGVEPGRLITEDGASYEADVIALATGFQPQRMLAPMEILGRDGRSLRDVWGDDDPRAFLGITVPGFPNMFCLLGPNTFAGHGGSGILTIELEVRYVMELIATMLGERIASVECRQDAHDAYNEELAEALSHTVWAHPGMTTYYRNSAGRIVVPMPWTNLDYWQRTRTPRLDDYVVRHH